MNPTQILLYDAIIDGDAKNFIQQLHGAGNAPIDLHVNSPGGNVFEGYAIYNALIAHPAAVTVYIDGIAASMASYIAMAGRTIVMASNAMMMIHNPSTFTGGDAEEIRRHAALLDKIKTSLVDAYARRSKHPREKIAAMMDDETWLTADMAKELGFVDEITAPKDVAAIFNMTRFRHPPAVLLNRKPTKDGEAIPGELWLLTCERNELQFQVKSLTTEISDLKKKCQEAVTGREVAYAMHAKVAKQLELLEGYAKVCGVDVIGVSREEAVAAIDESSSAGARFQDDRLLKEFESITDPTARSIFWAANKTALLAIAAKQRRQSQQK